MNACRCAKLSIGSGRNWNPDCPEHGLNTEWYDSPEQVERRRRQNERLRDLQRQAREARAKHRAQEMADAVAQAELDDEAEVENAAYFHLRPPRDQAEDK